MSDDEKIDRLHEAKIELMHELTTSLTLSQEASRLLAGLGVLPVEFPSKITALLFELKKLERA